MPSISFQQAFSLSSGCFISPLSNTKFNLTNENGQKVDLKTLVSGNSLDLSLVPSLVKDGTLNPENQSYSISDSDDLSTVFTTVGLLSSCLLVSGESKFICTNSFVSSFPENFKDGTTSYSLFTFGSDINAITSGTTGLIAAESYSITSIQQLVTGLSPGINFIALAIPGSIQITFNASNVGFAGFLAGILQRSFAPPLGSFNFFVGIEGWRIKITGVTTEPNLNGTLNIFPYYNEFVDNINDLVNMPVHNPSRVYKRGEFVSALITVNPEPGQSFFTNICYSLENGNTDIPGTAPDLNTPGSKWHSILASGVVGEFVEDAPMKIGTICAKKNNNSTVTITIPYNAFRQFKIGNNGLETVENNPWYVESWNNIENSDLILNEGTITFEPIFINKQGLNVTNLPGSFVVTMNNNAQLTALTVVGLQVIEASGGLIYKEGGSFDSNPVVSDTEKLYHFTGQKILKKIK